MQKHDFTQVEHNEMQSFKHQYCLCPDSQHREQVMLAHQTFSTTFMWFGFQAWSCS